MKCLPYEVPYEIPYAMPDLSVTRSSSSKLKAFLASTERVMGRSRMTLTGKEGTETDTGRGPVLLVSVSEGVPRTTCSRQVTKYLPSANYNII